ncbi:MAG: DUF4340 domain-containing protein [Treponema sp.]|jgi:hypothetical protein|nr:DUF4340 domain-containing protein [Treponema sp.]
MDHTTNFVKKTYRKLYALSGLVAALVVIYIATLIFEPERVNTRDSRFVWLDEKWVTQADGIEIAHEGRRIALSRKNGEWIVVNDGGEYPAKQLRVEDLLHVLAAKAAYPVRANTAHERFGLSEAASSRIVIRGGLSENPLLDLLVGETDAMGAVYLRKNKQDEVRSGMNSTLAGYAVSAVTSWYNLRLFPEDASGTGIDTVQRVVIQAPPPDDEAAASDNALDRPPVAPPPPPELSLTRQEGGWRVSDSSGDHAANTQTVEAYLRALLDIEGEDFAATTPSESSPFDETGWVRLELGDGNTRAIRFGPAPDAANRYHAIAQGLGARNGFVFVLSEWRKNTLFRNRSYFEPQ